MESTFDFILIRKQICENLLLKTWQEDWFIIFQDFSLTLYFKARVLHQEISEIKHIQNVWKQSSEENVST
jgi:hypothetical protein